MTKCVNNSNCVGIIVRRASAGFMYLLDITIISNTYIDNTIWLLLSSRYPLMR